jgi:ATP-dependent helicase HrpB
VGETIGLRVRLGSQVSARTRIEVVTEGVFARMILDDPELTGVSAVLFDEFHERSLDADLGLALALDAQGALRPELRILVMSATLDGARVAALLGGEAGERPGLAAPVIVSEGRAYPVETRHVARDPGQRIEDQVATTILRTLRAETGSILVFLPGQGEITRVAERLASIDDPSVEIAPLYGALEMAAQDRAVRAPGPGKRKVVLATAIAETSLTIEGVRVVIDSGLARVPVYEPDVGVTRLATVRVSRAAADQRRGRAGRTAPGVCIRLWEEAASGAMEAFVRPEILSADLSPLLLDCASWGVTDPRALRFLDAPPEPALAEARAMLIALGALGGEGRITTLGKRLNALPLPPRLARMLIVASERWGGEAAERAADLAAVIVERGLGGDGVDLAERVERFRRERGPRAEAMRGLSRRWARQAGGRGKGASAALTGQEPSAGAMPGAGAMLGAGAILALAYPDRIGKARGRPGAYLLANGRGAELAPHDRLARAPFIVVADMTGSATAARITAAAALEERELASATGEAIAGFDITVFDATEFDMASRALRRRAGQRLGAIVLAERALPVEPGEASALALAKGAAALGIARLPWSDAQRRLRARIAFLRAADPQGWPDLSDEALGASAADWLAPHLSGLTSLTDIDASLLDAALDALAPFSLRRRAESEAPSHFEAPTGSRAAVDYGAAAGPTVSIRVQELFGLTTHPTLAGGRVPLVLELLSPAHRPIQVTRDLPGFWAGSWAAVKAEMKGRYPRHPWPDDPAAAPPTTRAKPRGT